MSDTLDRIEELAKMADQDRLERPTERNQSFSNYIQYLSPEVVLAMVEVIRAATRMHTTREFDAALAKLEQMK